MQRLEVCAGTIAGGNTADAGDESGAETDGGAQGSESARLKLQTPIFVAEALLEAAEAQLGVEADVCRQEVCPCHHLVVAVAAIAVE